jgi:hypothetical protein
MSIGPEPGPGPAPGPGPGAGEPDATPGRSDQPEPGGAAVEPEPTPGRPSRGNMLPGRERRQFGLERLMVRIVATSGIVGIGVALAAILVSSKVQGWITGLVVATVSVVLSAVLWSSKQL